MSCCDCCIEVPTPQSIYDDDDRDVFEEIFTNTGLTYKTLMESALWATYRYYMIANCDVDTWIQTMKDRTSIIGGKWDDIFGRLLSGGGLDLTDLHEMDYTRTIKHEPISGTDGDVRTVSHEGDIVDKNEHESLPQTASDTTKYLDSRSTDTHTNGQTDTESYAPNTIDTEEYSEDRDLIAMTFSKMIREYPDVLDMFAQEYRNYFMQRW